MPELPNGTLTVLHTDIENSTALTRHLREQYPAVLATHRTLLRAVFTAYEGSEVDTQGDSFFVVFIRAARIKEAGHGGQVLLSVSTAAIIQDSLIDELSLRDLGAHRLKSLPRPERIFQLIVPGLPADFPSLQTLDSHAGPRSGTEGERVLTTLLFTDIVGSTQRLVALGDRHWREILIQHRVLVRRELAHYGGHEVQTIGDGFFATFDSPASAVRCACAIRETVKELGIEMRVGVHAGEVEHEGEDLHGIPLHIAARVMGMAGPGEVLVSSTVRDLVAGSGITFTERGSHILRGLPGEWQLFTPDVPESGTRPS